MLRFSSLAVAGVIVASQVFSGIAEAAPFYSFVNITNNDPDDADTGEAQLFVELVAAGANQLGFRFFNTGPLASSITQIYFDDGSLLGIASVINGAGVDISQGGAPPNLPGGNTIDFNTTAGFLATADAPTQPNGINPGESATVVFNLIAGQDIDDVIAALALGLANPGVDVLGGLRIGIHVQGFTGGGSESFVNNGRVPPDEIPGIPEPGSMTLLALGSIGLGGFLRRKMKKVDSVT